MSPRRLLAVLAAISALLVPAAVAWACNPLPVVETDELSYGPGDQMTISGSFFSSSGNPTVTISTDPAGASATGVPVTSAGTFQTTLDAPDQPGAYTLVATSSGTALAARTTFEVNTPPPTVPPPPAPGKCANDKLGTGGSDNLRGTNFGDRIFALGGNDVVNAHAADDCIDGGSGSDRLLGDAGNDRVFGRSGNDRASGGAGRVVVAGGSGRDVLTGDSGDDQLYGEGGNDTIYAGTGRTRIDAGTENDSVSARNGRADTINCGGGSDTARVDGFDRVAGCERVSRG
jgi:Ca2+-binding RTX toxin-like protein